MLVDSYIKNKIGGTQKSIDICKENGAENLFVAKTPQTGIRNMERR